MLLLSMFLVEFCHLDLDRVYLSFLVNDLFSFSKLFFNSSIIASLWTVLLVSRSVHNTLLLLVYQCLDPRELQVDITFHDFQMPHICIKILEPFLLEICPFGQTLHLRQLNVSLRSNLLVLRFTSVMVALVTLKIQDCFSFCAHLYLWFSQSSGICCLQF